jgi:catechol 2,3-dioxygenase-like lactoylglutathione lyase family enzyme
MQWGTIPALMWMHSWELQKDSPRLSGMMSQVKLLKPDAFMICIQSLHVNREGDMINHLDHLVLTTAKETACIDFYTRVLGMQLESFIGGTPPVERKAFRFGNQKINLHIKGKEFEPKADIPTPGSLDLCFIADRPLSEVITKLTQAQWPIIEGPVMRTGATQKINSVYVRDPDQNLIEISELI